MLQLASLVVLARLLTPHEFGLVAGVLALVGIAEVLRDFGLSTAGLRAQSLDRSERNVLFWGNAAAGSMFCLLVVGLAPLVGRLYSAPSLIPVARVLALTFLLNGLAAQFRVHLTRGLRLSKLAFIDVTAQAAGLSAAVVLAVYGAGYWALVVQQLVQATTGLLLVAAAAGWWPDRPQEMHKLKPFVRFGGTIMLAQVASYIGKNVDNVLVGARVGLVDLGVYSRAYSLLMTPLGQLRAPTTNIAVPVLSRALNDQRRYDEILRQGQLALGYGLVGLLALASGASAPLVGVLLGPAWAPAAPLVALLAYAGAMETLPYVAYWAYVSRGLAGSLLRFTLASTALRIVCIAVGSNSGAVGVAAGFVVGTALNWPISLWRLARVTPVDARTLLSQGARLLTLALVTTATARGAVWLSSDDLPLLQILLATAAAAVTYALAAASFRAVRRDLSDLRGFALALRPTRTS